ncbi:hypothetical protein CBS11852_3809 [Aspergillus niger]|nr:hypothetical protein CBS11350_5762 [Aspergillus niger]KAI2897798.1 hypothetical protein CBS11852_3809 [Aspergillus niger]
MSQEVQIPVGDNTIWRGYANLVKRLLVGPSDLANGLDYIYVCPPTERASAKINEANKKLTEVEGERHAAKKRAVEDWEHDPDGKAAHVPFHIWAIENADSYLQLEEQVNLASGQVDQLQSRYFGPAAAVLREKKEKLEKRAGSQTNSNPGYNMPCFIGDYAIDETALDAGVRVENIDARDLLYEPLYAIDGHESMCDSWIRGDAGDGLVSTVDFRTIKHDDWTELGHSQNSSRQANSFFFFFSKSSGTSSAETHLNFNGSDWKLNTKIEITMHGQQTFNITPGLWDDPGVRRTFPTLLEGATDTALGLVRVSKILVAHKVSVKIHFDESLRTQVRNMVSQAKSESNGALRIFGFQFGRDTSSGSSFYRDVNQVDYDEAKGVLTIPETPRGCPVLLGILGRKIGA